MITHYPNFAELNAGGDCGLLERLFSEWFGGEVILTSSGRAAMLLYFSVRGLDRYRDTIALPRMISGCVLDVVVKRAFPVDLASGGRSSLTLTYHQYGFPQVWAPEGPALDDMCHAFFFRKSTHCLLRPAEVAVFSLPKFFSTSGMCGGLLVRDTDLSTLLRNLRDQLDNAPSEEREQMGAVFRRHYHKPDLAGCSALGQMYSRVLATPSAYCGDLAGVPTTLGGIEAISATRAHIAELIVGKLGNNWFPEGWASAIPKWLPFAIPAFHPDEQRLRQIDHELIEHGITAGVYRIDVRRDARRPQYREALLLPCHQDIGEDALAAMLDIVAWGGR